MKKWSLFLVLGVVLGFYGFPKSSAPVKQETSVSVVSSPVVEPTPITQKVLKTERGTMVITKLDSGSNAPIAEEPVLQPPIRDRVITDLRLNLGELMINQLEKDFEQLKNGVYTVQEPEGWRIHLSPNSELSALGFQDGDLITHESLDAQASTPERTELTGRFISLLMNLQKPL